MFAANAEPEWVPHMLVNRGNPAALEKNWTLIGGKQGVGVFPGFVSNAG
jgi:hypothetical protein